MAVLLAVLSALLTASLHAEKPAPVDKPASILERADPEYTDEARKARLEGTVILSGLIGTDGKVTDIVLVRPMGYGLGDKAIECVRKWRFKPATRDGVPRAVRARLEVGFRLPSP